MSMMLHWILNFFVVLIVLKYVLILIGYFTCFIVTRVVQVPIDRESVRTLAEKNRKPEAPVAENQTVPRRLMTNLKRYINGWVNYSLVFTGRIPSHGIRTFIYRHVYGVRVGRNAVLYGRSEMRAPYNVVIGEGSIVGDSCKLDGRNGIIIGKNVNLSTGVWIWTDQHDPQCPYFSCTDEGGPVIIEDRAWISCRTVILPRVTIGEGAVIAAGAVVTRDVEPFSIYGGVPAKKIGERNRNLHYEFKGEPLPFY
jgi:acetyltransferase-like isoleucine patch superfamily enzyme